MGEKEAKGRNQGEAVPLEDRVLRRMLNTPPQPRKAKPSPARRPKRPKPKCAAFRAAFS